jgi:hypothetical protein
MILSTCGLPLLAGQAPSLRLLEGAHAPKIWDGPGVPGVKPQAALHKGGAGLTLPLPMRQHKDRAYWDAAHQIDLTRWQVLTFDIQIEHPAAIKRASIHFRSGNGWYSGWVEIPNNHWQSITLSRADFDIEGSPAGWDKIQAVRISFWKQADINTTARIANLQATNLPILLLRNTDARAQGHADAGFVDRTTDRLQLWLRQQNLPAAVITDDNLRSAPPPTGTRLIILPFNPVINQALLQRLQTFTRQGGKLIVTYTLDAPMASLLGLERWQWMKAEPADAFAFMHFPNGSGQALPARVAQDSWNINRPFPAPQTRVLATWQNGQGVDSGIPAVTLSHNGVYIGHILTNAGREDKMRMLMALMAMLVPDMSPILAAAAIDQSTRLLDHPDWTSTRACIARSAKEHRQQRTIAPQLDAIDQDLLRIRERLPTLSYPQTATHAWSIAKRIQQAYYESLRPTNAARHEFRGVWAHDAAGIRGQPWLDSVAALKAAGINNLFPNLLWGGAAFYPSDVLPTVAGKRDFAREVIEAGKQHDIRIHAWMVLWSLQHAPAEFVQNMRQQGRLQNDKTDKELPWLCPSHPENRQLTIRAAVEIVEKYPFDGLHLDYVRFPDANACYCKGCRQRFAEAKDIKINRWPQDVTEGPHRTAYQQWRREIISTIVNRIHDSVKRAKPRIALSAAVCLAGPLSAIRLHRIGPTGAGRDGLTSLPP